MPAPLRPLSGRRRFTLLAVAALVCRRRCPGRRLRSPARDAGGHARAVPGRHRTGLAVADGDRARDAIADGEPADRRDRSRSSATSRSPEAARRSGRRPPARRHDCGSSDRTGTAHTSCWPTAWAGRPSWPGRPMGLASCTTDDDKLLLTDASGGRPQPVDIGCAPPPPATTPLSCQYDAVAFSSDGRSIVFVRTSTDATGSIGPAARHDGPRERPGVRLNCDDARRVVRHPGWSPDGRRIVFFRYGDKDSGGLSPPRRTRSSSSTRMARTCIRSARRRSPPSSPNGRPDGARIVFVSQNGEQQDIYTMRPDGIRRAPPDDGRVLDSGDLDGRWADPVHPRPAGRRRARAGGRWTRTAPTRPCSCRGRRSAFRPKTSPSPPRPGSRSVDRPSCPRRGRRRRRPPSGHLRPRRPRRHPDLAPGFSWTGPGDRRGRTLSATRRRGSRTDACSSPPDAARQPSCTTRRPARSARRAPCPRSAPARPPRSSATDACCSRVATTARRPARTGPGRRPSCTTRRPARSARPARWPPHAAAHGHPAGRRPRAHRRRSVGTEPGDGRRGHPRLVSDRRGRRLPDRPPSSTTRPRGRSARPVR